MRSTRTPSVASKFCTVVLDAKGGRKLLVPKKSTLLLLNIVIPNSTPILNTFQLLFCQSMWTLYTRIFWNTHVQVTYLPSAVPCATRATDAAAISSARWPFRRLIYHSDRAPRSLPNIRPKLRSLLTCSRVVRQFQQKAKMVKIRALKKEKKNEMNNIILRRDPSKNKILVIAWLNSYTLRKVDLLFNKVYEKKKKQK